MLIVAAGCGDNPASKGPDGFSWTDTTASEAEVRGADGIGGNDSHVDAVALPAGASCGANVMIRRVAAWPGGGAQLLVSLEADGRPVDAFGAPTPYLRGTDGARHALTLATADVKTRVGVILVRGGEAADDQRTATLAETLIAGLAEATAAEIDYVLFGIDGSAPTVLSQATADQGHLGARLGAWVAARPPVAVTADAVVAGAIIAARDQLARLGGPDGPADRVLVALHPSRVIIADGQSSQGVDAVRVHHVFVDDPAAASRVGTLVAEIPNVHSGFARLGACRTPVSTEAMTLVWGDAECPFAWPKVDPHLAGAACEAAAAATDTYPWGDTVSFVFTPDEAAAWQDRRENSSRDDFSVGVKIDGGQPLRAVARLRGHSSLGCERKSYTINIQGSNPYRLMRRGASDKFYLIAMCLDEGYFNQLFADRLGQELGFFPLEFRVVRLVAGGVDQGAYLMLEKADAAVVQDMVTPWAVLRRRFDPEDEAPDIDWVGDGVSDAEALAFWTELNTIATSAPEADLEAALGAKMDLDAYLQWLAFNTFMQNGDYVDEVIFFGSQEGSGAERAPFMHILGWDPDDLFSDCHHNSIFALDDPHKLLFCAEGDLDHAVIRSPAIYARFVQHLEAVMGALPASKLAEAMAQTRSSLLAVVDNDTTAAAMIELQATFPNAKTATGFDLAVTGLMDALLQNAEASRARLQGGIARWREGASR